MKRPAWKRMILTFAFVAALPAATVRGEAEKAVVTDHSIPASLAAPPATDLQVLDYAFRFATAIATDAKDRTRAQEEVVRAYAARGRFAEARERAGGIDGWRRGTALADLATDLARAGRVEEARVLVTEAEKVRAATTGWQGPRIDAHIAAALAILGDAGRARTMAASLAAEDRQYAGRASATVAAARARSGDFEGAMAVLAAIDADPDMDVSWWRTEAYLDLARQAGDDRARRDHALEAARRSAASLPDWKKAEALIHVAEALIDGARLSTARAALRESEAIALSLALTMPVRAPLLADLARAWEGCGDVKRARGLLREAQDTIPAVPSIDRPALYARVGAAHEAIGERAMAGRLYGRALDEAGGLVNARPRALAVVEICRVLAGAAAALDPWTRDRLNRLFEGLRDPW